GYGDLARCRRTGSPRVSVCDGEWSTASGRWRVRRTGPAAVGAALFALLLVVPLPGVVPLPAGPWLPAAAAHAPGVDVVPVLTSTPFAAAPGQVVIHTVTLSGTGPAALPAARVTFTTTVPLDGVIATASAGSCPV